VEGFVVVFQGIGQRLKVRGERRFEEHLVAGYRMLETEFGGVERLPAEAAIRKQTEDFKSLAVRTV
jgi:hypothetical protein